MKFNVQGFGHYIQFGLQIGVTMAMPVLLGFWLDRRYETGMAFTLTGVFLGFVSMVWTIIKTALELNEKDKREKKLKNGNGD